MYGDKRVLKAFTWDGKTKYKVAETEEEEKERLKKWDEFLEGSSDTDDKKAEESTEEAKESTDNKPEESAAASQ